MPSTPSTSDTSESLDARAVCTLAVSDIVEALRVVRTRYHMPDTSAFVRYVPRFDAHPEDLYVKVDPFTEPHTHADATGTFSLPQLVGELEFAYITVHLFPTRSARDVFVSGFDYALRQVEFVDGSVDWRRLWLTAGLANVGIPIAIFLGQRNAINGRPSVSLIDHRTLSSGALVYRAVGGSGDHVGEEYFEPPAAQAVRPAEGQG